MNIKNNIIFFLCFFPIFVFKSNLSLFNILLIFGFFFLLTVINFFFLKKFKDQKRIYQNLYLSFILTYGFDNYLGLFNGLIQSNISFFFRYFEIIYFPAVLILLIFYILILIIVSKTDYEKISKIFLIIITTLFLFNVIDDTKSHKKIPFFEQKIVKTFDKKTLVMIWDEMSGLDSLSSKTKEGQKFNKEFENLFKNFFFNIYPKAYTISENSVGSISSLINFHETLDLEIQKFSKVSKNYFNEYDINKNLFFDKFKSISVIQNIHLNYCNHQKVKKCYQYNPLNLGIIEAKIDPLSNIVSSWALNGSIISKLTWRILKHFSLIKSTLEPEGEKLFIKNILNYSHNDLASNKYDLIFMHLLVPHKPYGFSKNCDYDVSKSNLNIFMSIDEHIYQHNIERSCVIFLLKDFLKKINSIDDFRIIILSDHGSRITKADNSSLSSIFAYKDFKKRTFNIKNEKVSIQSLFKKINNE